MKKTKRMKKKPILTLAMMVLLLTVAVGGTIAYLVTSTDQVQNQFTPGKVTSQVKEEWTENGTEKKNVTISNTGNVDAYIRAAIVVTWKDSAGKTMPEVPRVGTDYTISTGSDWEQSGDYYYYNKKVAPGASTTNLINSCIATGNGNYTDERKLCVEVIGSAIQAEGMGATRAQEAFTIAANN